MHIFIEKTKIQGDPRVPKVNFVGTRSHFLGTRGPRVPVSHLPCPVTGLLEPFKKCHLIDHAIERLLVKCEIKPKSNSKCGLGVLDSYKARICQALLTWSLILVLSHILQAIFQLRGQLSDIS